MLHNIFMNFQKMMMRPQKQRRDAMCLSKMRKWWLIWISTFLN